MKSGWRVVAATLVLFLSVAIGVLQYRGPTPLGVDASADRPSAARMRETLVTLLGDPPEVHSTGTDSGEQFLRRLEAHVSALGFGSRRIEIPWDPESQKRHPKGQVQFLPDDAVLKNLLVTVDGSEPGLAPILVATHHDSCRWGPGAGDAGSAVVALVEHLRILSINPPNRTTHYLFTDGEEYGLLGAYAVAALDTLPFRDPVFVLNFDARGTTGGVPMFETHSDNQAWVSVLIDHLAAPKITSSLAVTVYRTLPNATDFNVWNQELEFDGFNYATIGGAHRYHQVDDRPENVSDRTLQHMGDHLHSMHQAIDSLGSRAVGDLVDEVAGQPKDNSVFFDVYGVTVIHFSESTQKIISIVSAILLGTVWFWSYRKRFVRLLLTHVSFVGLSVLSGCLVGWIARLILWTTPWRNLKYTPVDLPAGLLTAAIAFLVTTLLLRKVSDRHRGDAIHLGELNWWVFTTLGIVVAFALPGGGYLLVIPGAVYTSVRVVARNPTVAAWCGLVTLAVLVGPLLSLLVQALGPWRQHLYGIIAGLIAVSAMTVWNGNREHVGHAIA